MATLLILWNTIEEFGSIKHALIVTFPRDLYKRLIVKYIEPSWLAYSPYRTAPSTYEILIQYK